MTISIRCRRCTLTSERNHLVLEDGSLGFSPDTIRNIKVTQKRNDFGFGAAIGHKALEESKQYRDYFLENFEWGVPENAMKWDMVEAKRGEKRYENMEKILKILNDSDIKIRGHCIFWEQESQLPKWVGDLSNRELTKALEDRLEDVMDKYAGKFEHWDVNNEMLHGSTFSDKLAVGTWVREWMYKRAHERDPKAKLFVNDFDVVANGIFTQSFWELIRGFLEKKIPIHAIGVQGHFFGWTHPRILQERLDILSQAKLPIWITEMDILEHDERKRARALEHIMRTAFSHPSVDGIVLWAFWSKAAWRGRDTALINDDFSLNEAGRKYMELRKEWRTEETLSPTSIFKNSCEFKFRGFHGDYEITVLFPDGQKITNEVKVSKKEEPLVVEVDTHVANGPLND